MPGPYLRPRLDLLRQSQNGDGGWGYFPGKASWLEPTAYAALALHGEPAADRAWALLQTWQLPDGSWRPSGVVKESSWATSLCATIAMARNESGAALEKGVAWLVGSVGAEATWFNVVVSRLGLVDMDRDFSLRAWPWKPGNSGWVEPTAHALVAPQARLRPSYRAGSFRNRASPIASPPAKPSCSTCVRATAAGTMENRPCAASSCRPIPETTALALLGLQGRPNLGKAFEVATARNRPNAVSPGPRLADHRHAALRHYGSRDKLTAPPPDDLMMSPPWRLWPPPTAITNSCRRRPVAAMREVRFEQRDRHGSSRIPGHRRRGRARRIRRLHRRPLRPQEARVRPTFCPADRVRGHRQGAFVFARPGRPHAARHPRVRPRRQGQERAPQAQFRRVRSPHLHQHRRGRGRRRARSVPFPRSRLCPDRRRPRSPPRHLRHGRAHPLSFGNPQIRRRLRRSQPR